MKKLVLFLLLALASVGIWYYIKNPLSARVRIADQEFLVDLAVTPRQRERGLSGRQSLGENKGMLFLFGSPGVYHFWMRGMQFPLDFIWIKDNTVVDIDINVPHPVGGQEPVELAPDVPVDKVLEVTAGTVYSHGIAVGDTVSYPNK